MVLQVTSRNNVSGLHLTKAMPHLYVLCSDSAVRLLGEKNNPTLKVCKSLGKANPRDNPGSSNLELCIEQASYILSFLLFSPGNTNKVKGGESWGWDGSSFSPLKASNLFYSQSHHKNTNQLLKFPLPL